MIERERLTAEHTLEANYLILKCEQDEELDEIACNVLKEDLPEFLLPIHVRNVNGCAELRFRLGNQMALKYRDLTMNRKQFLTLFESLLIPFMEAGDWMLDYHYLCIDMGSIFVDKTGKSVKYLYLPVNSESVGNTDDEILAFFRGVLENAEVPDGSDFLLKMYQCFSKGSMTLSELYRMIRDEKNANISAISGKRDDKLPGAGSPVKPSFPNVPKRQDVEPKPQPAVNIDLDPDKPDFTGEPEQEDVMNALFGTGGKKDTKKETKKEKRVSEKNKGTKVGIFGGRKKNESKESPASSGISIPFLKKAEQPADNVQEVFHSEPVDLKYEYTQIDEDDFGDVTQIDDAVSEKRKLCLRPLNDHLSGIPGLIDLDFSKNQIYIGRRSHDSRQPDVVFGPEHGHIGRMHACIQREGDQYFLVDLGSANGTLLNGRVLVPNQPYPLQLQDVIGFVAADPIEYRMVQFTGYTY